MKTLIDFYAEWCGPCIAMKPVFAEVENELEGKILFKKIDVDKNPEEAQKFNVMSIPTFIIVDEEGKEVDKKMGAMPKEQLLSWINSHINN
jgi:thioredoxin